MTDQFDPAMYRREMESLLVSFFERWSSAHADLPVYTITVRTDVNSAASGVSVDTFENSDRRYTELFRSLPDPQELNLPPIGDICARGWSPSIFAFPLLVRVTHQSFPRRWDYMSDEACYDEICPVAKQIVYDALPRMRSLAHHPDAVLVAWAHYFGGDACWLFADDEEPIAPLRIDY